MNWLGANPLSLFAALLGAAAGLVLYGQLALWGQELPLCVGVCAGVGAALSTSQANLMRGLVVGTLAAWFGAAAQVLYVQHTPLLVGLREFHRHLDGTRLFAHLLSVGLAIAIGGRSLRGASDARIVGG